MSQQRKVDSKCAFEQLQKPANEYVENETRFKTANYGLQHSRRQIDQSVGD